MIDTDKYEGHTPAPWELIEREGTGLFNLVMWRREEKKPVAYAYNSGKYTYEYPNAQLIADAPLRLEELIKYKKLYEYRVARTRENWAEIERLREEVRWLRDTVCLLEDSRITNMSIHDRPELFADVAEVFRQRKEDTHGHLPNFGEEE